MRKMFALILILMFSLSCKDKPVTGPEDIYYGEDICQRCKMIISEKEFAAEYTLPGGNVRKFDDIGCMIHYISGGEEGETEWDDITAYYVKDYASGEWIDGDSAYYVWGESVKTPMGYGVIAFSEENAANDIVYTGKGKLLGGFKEAVSMFNK